MRVTSSAYSASLNSQIQTLVSRQVKLQGEAASGQRITNAEDDPAAMGRVLNAQSDQGRVQQFYRNSQQALNVNQASFAGVSSLKDLSDRAGEIAALTGGTSDAASMKAYATEVNQMMEQAVQSANGKLDTSYLFGGTKSDTPPFTATRDASGQITNVSYQGAASGAQIAVDGGTTISPYTSGSDNSNIASFINSLGKLRDALNSGDANAVQSMRTELSGGEDHLLNTLGTLGAVQTRLEAASTAASTRFNNLETQISADADVDLPTTIIKLTQAQTAYQTSLQTGAKILNQSLLSYIN